MFCLVILIPTQSCRSCFVPTDIAKICTNKTACWQRIQHDISVGSERLRANRKYSHFHKLHGMYLDGNEYDKIAVPATGFGVINLCISAKLGLMPVETVRSGRKGSVYYNSEG